MKCLVIFAILTFSNAENIWESATAKQKTITSSGKEENIRKTETERGGLRRKTQGTDCFDSPARWYDSDGPFYDCAWYALEGEKDEHDLCPDYGDNYMNCEKSAQEACCACGGGVPKQIEIVDDCTLFDEDELPELVEGRPLFSDDSHQFVVAPLKATVMDSSWNQITTGNTPAHNDTTCGKNNVDPITLLTSEQRDSLAAKWRNRAQYEHASVASFSKFAIHLQSVAAPPDLVRASHKAAIQEIGHAQLCLSTANLFAPISFTFGQLPVSSIQIDGTLKSIAYSTAAEGAVGETVAAFRAAIEHQLAMEHGGLEHIKKVLRTIMYEEAQHAVLAWKTLQWVLKEASTSPSEKEDLMALILKGLGLQEYDDSENMIVWPSNVEFPCGFGYLDTVQSKVITRVVKKEVIQVVQNWLFGSSEIPLSFSFMDDPDSILMRVGENSVSNVTNYFISLMMGDREESCSWSEFL
eukprot:CAMPEP_0195512918 /NCGR_PEP_ID=MMETSP0794_2-20130614/4709_1 /TAXON_ID=515487 /ORGANISM="Stephanopyxis turris, Strain CCMP 815" /LENGTH=467 /DNA_ID=CAMNT_0040640807 /DNA_START=16 /DNA_END=1419 /DNA_ORIENTATION=-